MPHYVPLSRERHATRSWRRFQDYGFARSRAAVPVMFAEAMVAASAMPLAFVREQEGYNFVAVMSLPPGRNAFVAPQTGKWLGPYVPAHLRIYPFLFIKPPVQADPSVQVEPILCIDEESGLVLEASAGGEPLFGADGKPSEALQGAANSAVMVEQNRAATALATAALADAGLIVPWEVTLTVEGTQRGVAGLFHVDFGKLETLAPEELAKLHAAHAIGMAYAQLVSEGRVSDLVSLTAQSEGALTASDAQRLGGIESLDSIFGVSSDGNLRFGS